MKDNLIFSEFVQNDLAKKIVESCADDVFFLTDENTREHCWPLVRGKKKWAYPVEYQFAAILGAKPIVIPAGEAHKNLESVAHVWDALQRGGATRHSLLVNLGGGMVTDLGGFAASTFKRGMAFINIPTTLLSMVDASVGGKTGVNFGGLKNEVGVFSEPQAVIIDPRFLATLDRENLLSGYAEMLKHGLLDTVDHWAELLASDSSLQFSAILKKSIAVKERIVAADPRE
ncbi:MAG: 3-dehydroquinate synthase, partial [Prevotella sp.]|nr:3-dehydroquinate synthase [Prevotella sp.]